MTFSDHVQLLSSIRLGQSISRYFSFLYFPNIAAGRPHHVNKEGVLSASFASDYRRSRRAEWHRDRQDRAVLRASAPTPSAIPLPHSTHEFAKSRLRLCRDQQPRDPRKRSEVARRRESPLSRRRAHRSRHRSSPLAAAAAVGPTAGWLVHLHRHTPPSPSRGTGRPAGIARSARVSFSPTLPIRY